MMPPGVPLMKRQLAVRLLLACPLTLAAAPAIAQETPSRELTLEAIFSPDPEERIEFGGSPLTGLEWSARDGEFLQPAEQESTFSPPLLVEARSGRTAPLFDAAELVRSLAALEGYPEQDAKRLLDDEVRLGPLQRSLLIDRANDLYHYSIPQRDARRLTNTEEPEELVHFSPDGERVAFVRHHDLHVIQLADGEEVRLTLDGEPNLLNGKLDWVYQEEIYGRGDFKGYWWSPDSATLAFLQLDESPVHRYTLVDHLPVRSRTEIVHYPKAGDPNPRVRLGLVPAEGGEILWIDTSSYESDEPLIVRVGWTPDSRNVVFMVQNREQAWLDIRLADRQTGRTRRLLRETSGPFVDRDLTGEIHWLQDGSFLWLSARSGYHHLYHFAADGELLRQVTQGDWEVRQIHGVDEGSNRVYFAASEHSPIELHLYRVGLDGSGLRRLSSTPGTHRAQFDPSLALYLDTWSDIDTPPRVLLHRADGKQIRVIDANPVAALEAIDLAPVEFLQVPSADGFLFAAALIKPPDFDPSRRYPVFQHNYGGPHAQTVRNAWGGSRGLWLRYLAQEGFVVWMCDNRSASAKGIWPTWQAHGKMGVIELADMEECLSWLKKKPWVDGQRTAIHGGSYGGFMASLAMTHGRAYKVGIAFAPVTDWRLYDTVYTERYMGRPADNPDGYSETSVIEAADRLHGRFLLIHGTMDDNVHLQNTIQLVDALQKAGKSFDLMLYPNSRHGVRDKAQILHLYRLKTRFLLENL